MITGYVYSCSLKSGKKQPAIIFVHKKKPAGDYVKVEVKRKGNRGNFETV